MGAKMYLVRKKHNHFKSHGDTPPDQWLTFYENEPKYDTSSTYPTQQLRKAVEQEEYHLYALGCFIGAQFRQQCIDQSVDYPSRKRYCPKILEGRTGFHLTCKLDHLYQRLPDGRPLCILYVFLESC